VVHTSQRLPLPVVSALPALIHQLAGPQVDGTDSISGIGSRRR